MKQKKYVPTNIRMERNARKMLEKLANSRHQSMTYILEQLVREEHARVFAGQIKR